MKIGRQNSKNRIVFSAQKTEPSSSSSSSNFSSSSSSSSSQICQIDSSQLVIQIPIGSNFTSGLGLTFASYQENKFYYDFLSDYDGLPNTMRIFVSGVEVGLVTWNQPYAGTSFVFEMVSNGVSNLYCGDIISGEINF